MHKTIGKAMSDIEISGLSNVTQKRYINIITNFLKFVESNGNEMNIEGVKNYIKYLKNVKNRCSGTINDHRSAIKYLYEVILDLGWNDRKLPRLKDYKPIPVVLSKNEVIRILNGTNNLLLKAIFTTMYSSGLRISEVIDIRTGDIDSENMQIYIRRPKSGKARYAILSEKNLELLRKYFKKYWKKRYGKWEKEDYLFCSYKKDNPVTSKTIRKELKKAAKEAGIKKELTPHTFRHSFAVHLLEAGTNLLLIKELLGHKSIVSTCIYLQLVNIKVMGGKSPLDM
jgi:site-specific recombinase XerD